MRTIAFALIFSSAFIHATWNTATRHLKGNTPVLVFAHFLGTLLCFPLVLYLDSTFYISMTTSGAVPIYIASSFVHALYILLLSTAYVYGDVGLVYPLARGTAIVLSTWGSSLFEHNESSLSSTELIGVAVVVSGIFGLFWDSWSKAASSEASRPAGVYSALPLSDETGSSDLLGIEMSIPHPDAINDFCAEDSAGKDSKTESEHDGESAMNSSVSETSRKLLTSIALAMGVGVCTASYSILDSLGVQDISAMTWSFCMNFLSIGILLPISFVFYRKQTAVALQEHKKEIVLIAPFTVGAYLIILFVFSFPGVNVALVVTLREFAVLIGATFGVIFLGEHCSILKFASIIVMLSGMVIIKIS